jgi:hypothetical protein
MPLWERSSGAQLDFMNTVLEYLGKHSLEIQERNAFGIERAKVQRKIRDCGNNSWISNLDSLTRVQEPRPAAPPPGPLQSGGPTQAASVPSALGLAESCR